MEFTKCNLCGSDSSDLIAVFKDNLFDIPGEFPYVRCNNCGLCYISHRPTTDEIASFYPDEYLPYKTAIQDERLQIMRWARRNNLRIKKNLLDRYAVKVPGKLLDVGCSTGIFLDYMREGGWETVGVETNPNAVGYARQRFNLEVLEGELSQFDIPPGSFDMITMWDVLEHTHDPKKNLALANSFLADDGILALTLPNWDSLDRKIFGLNWVGYDAPRHLYVFTFPVLNNMLEGTGFHVVHAHSGLGGYYTSLASLRIFLIRNIRRPMLRKFILNILFFPGVRVIFQPLFSLIEALNLGGTLVIIARKTISDR